VPSEVGLHSPVRRSCQQANPTVPRPPDSSMPEAIFQHVSRAQEGAFATDRTYLDLPAEIGSDSTTVPRMVAGLRPFLPPAHDAELSVHVQAVIGADLGAPWVGRLFRAAPAGTRPIKWQHVEQFVRAGVGPEAQTVRDGLQTQTLVLTDAHQTVRSLDLSLTIAGATIPLATMLLQRRGTGALTGELLHLHEQIRAWVLRDVLERSGVGIVESLIRRARWQDLDGVFNRRSALDLTTPVIERLGGKINRVSKAACQATALAARYLDPETQPESAESLMASMRFSAGLPWFYAQNRLLDLTRQRVAFDADDSGVTATIEDIRRLGYSAADELGLVTDEGGVRAVDDADYIRVQLADVVCGWGRTVVYEKGLAELVRRFRLVLYNGSPLTPDRADRLDKQRQEHRRLLEIAAARGWTP
jgi:hypothetical protein